MKAEYTPEKETIASGEVIELRTRFGGLSRGHSWGKVYPGKTAPIGAWNWVDKEGGTLYLTEPGFYIVGSSDGFNRKAKATFVLKAE